MPVEIPATPVGQQLTWVIEMLRGESPSPKEVKQRFAPSFLAAVPVAQFLAMTPQIQGMVRGFDLEGWQSPPTDTQAVAILAMPNGDMHRLAIAVGSKKPHLIEGLQVQQAPDLRKEPAAKSWEELDEKVSKLAGRAGLLAAEISNGELYEVHGLNTARPLALGSAFKLYILGELTRQGDLWDKQLKVDAGLKSYPSGTMQNEKAGTKFSVTEFANKMISISDNTATDHLLFLAGRENVESVQKEMGHHNPSLNVPFISTREMFALKLGPKPRLEKFVKGGAEERMNILEKLPAKLPPVSKAKDWTAPRNIDTVEWFGSPQDMCRAMAWFKPHAAPRAVLSINPGLPFDKYHWTYIGFKGGSEPGVLNMTWLLERLDGRSFAMSVGLNDDDKAVSDAEAAALMIAAGALLATHRKKPKKGQKI